MGPRHNQAWFWFFVVLFIMLLAFLVGPPIPNDRQVADCVYNVHLKGPFGVSLVCDSPELLRLATHPSALLEPHNNRQSRPGLVLAAAILTVPLSPLRGLAGSLGVRVQTEDRVGSVQHGKMNPGKVSNALANFPPAYVAYLLLTILFLASAFVYLQKICRPAASPLETMIVVTAGLLLLANHNVKFFVWSPHMQVFNLLVPLLGVNAAMQAWSDGLRERRYAVAMGVMTGFGLTAYAFFAVIVPCLVLPAVVRIVRLQWQEARLRLANVAIVVTLSVLPFAAWFLFVWLKTGGFYNAEVVEYDSVVWMRDAWAHGATALATALAQKLGRLIELAATQAIGVAVMLAWVLAVPICAGTRVQLRAVVQLIGAALFVSALAAVFYTSVGIVEVRIAYAMVPPLIAIAAAVALASARQVSPRCGWFLASGCFVVAVTQALVTVVKSDAGAPP